MTCIAFVNAKPCRGKTESGTKSGGDQVGLPPLYPGSGSPCRAQTAAGASAALLVSAAAELGKATEALHGLIELAEVTGWSGA